MIVRAWEHFPNSYGVAAHDSGVLRHTVSEGADLAPHQEIAEIETEDLSLSVGVDHFGTLRRWLVEDGAVVMPGQPLAEFNERTPTTDEWTEQWQRANDAEARLARIPPRRIGGYRFGRDRA